MNLKLERLTQAIQAVCPVATVAGDGTFAPDPTATPEQIAAAELLGSADPIPQAVRVLQRAIQDCQNKRWRLVAEGRFSEATPVLEAEILQTVAAYLAEGLSLPG